MAGVNPALTQSLLDHIKGLKAEGRTVLFVEHDLERISPIDTQLIGILKDIMLLAIGAVGGLVGRKGAYAAANMLTKKEDGDASTRPTA